MKNKRKWNRKAAILAAAVLTSAFSMSPFYSYAYGGTATGVDNLATGDNSYVISGHNNKASGEYSVIIRGQECAGTDR